MHSRFFCFVALQRSLAKLGISPAVRGPQDGSGSNSSTLQGPRLVPKLGPIFNQSWLENVLQKS